MNHPQISVKVNAQVDKGIAPLVEAISQYPDVVTVSSCEGEETQDAYVSFVIGDDWRHLCSFVDALSPALGQNKQVSDLPFALSVEWYAGGKTPAGYLRVPRQHIPALADAVRSAKARVTTGHPAHS
jgi:hypothetical protein